MNSKQKKLAALSRILIKLSNDRDDDSIKKEIEAVKREVKRELTDSGGISFPLEFVLREGGTLKDLGIDEGLLEEDEPANPQETEDHAIKVLKRAGLYGFGGKCAEAAIAINDVLFNNEGRLVAAANKWLWENEGRFVGHVAVEWNGSYWDTDGKKNWDHIESSAMLDPRDLDYNFGTEDEEEKEERASIVSTIYPTKEELIEMFGGCNLNSLIRSLEAADKMVRDSEK